MTYNEFMKLFNEYKICRIKLALQNYNSDAEAAADLGVSTSFICRLRAGKVKNPTKENLDKLTRLIGNDLYDSEVKSARDLEIEYLENRLKKIKGE